MFAYVDYTNTYFYVCKDLSKKLFGNARNICLQNIAPGEIIIFHPSELTFKL